MTTRVAVARRTCVSVGSPPAMLDAGDRLAAHPEAAGGQVVAGLQGDADRAGEDVGLLRRRARAASRSARGSAAGRGRRAARGRCSESSTWKSLGTRRRSRLRICAELSTSRLSAEAISTGCTALRKVRAKTPEISCSSLFSKRCRPLMPPPLQRRSVDAGTQAIVAVGSRAARGPVWARWATAWDNLTPASRASGGIGRRARFRSVCPKGRGGSTPPSRTSGRAPGHR